MKNILFLEQFSAISGGQVVLLQILDGLDRNRYKPYVIIPQKGALSIELEKRGIPYYLLPMGRYSIGRKTLWDIVKYAFFSLILIPLCVYIIKKKDIDLIYANAPRTYLLGTLAAYLTQKPIVWHLHSILSGLELKLCLMLLKRFRVIKVIVISKAVRRPFLQFDPSFDKKIVVVYNGVDCKHFDPFKVNAKEIRRGLNIPRDYKVIGYIGQLARWKGVEDFIRAAKYVLERYPKSMFLIIGEVIYGGRKEEAYKDYLLGLTNELLVSNQVKFLGRRRDIPQLLAVMDILVVPSVEPEPLSLALLEGMAMGKAVIASAHGGPIEVIEDGVDGKLFPPGDCQALAKTILWLLQNPQLMEKLGEAARRKVVEKFSFSSQVEKIQSILAEVLSAR